MEKIQEKVEDEIIDWIALGAGGRLVAFKPEKGADLVVEKKGDYPGKEIFFNLKILITPSKTKGFNQDILQSELNLSKNHFLIFLMFDEVTQKINEKIWLVPNADFTKSSGVIKFEEDKFSKYLTNKNKFVFFLIERLISENKDKPKVTFKPRIY